MESVLDRSNSYLRIFNSPVKIDKTLPKWAIIEPVKKKDVSNLNSNDFDGDISLFTMCQEKPGGIILPPKMYQKFGRISVNNPKALVRVSICQLSLYEVNSLNLELKCINPEKI